MYKQTLYIYIIVLVNQSVVCKEIVYNDMYNNVVCVMSCIYLDVIYCCEQYMILCFKQIIDNLNTFTADIQLLIGWKEIAVKVYT